MHIESEVNLIKDVRSILESARKRAYVAVNTIMVECYWMVGKRIVEDEQNGEKRAGYGQEILKALAKDLTQSFGKGFSLSNVKNFRQFYLAFPDLFPIGQTVSGELERATHLSLAIHLSWSHYQLIMRINDQKAKDYYLKEAAANNWSVRTLDRNISSLYYRRLLSSQDKEPVEAEMREQTAQFQSDPNEFIKNPVVLEFLNLPSSLGYSEAKLEQALLNNLQQFLLELGKGFAFVARQKLMRSETRDFYIDLVFYNYILKCFVVVELKTNQLTHQDVGQLDMYVRMFDDLERNKGDQPTIGILLCTETDHTIAKYSVLNENKQLFASKYLPYLPTEEELVAEIEREKLVIKMQSDVDPD